MIRYDVIARYMSFILMLLLMLSCGRLDMISNMNKQLEDKIGSGSIDSTHTPPKRVTEADNNNGPSSRQPKTISTFTKTNHPPSRSESTKRLPGLPVAPISKLGKGGASNSFRVPVAFSDEVITYLRRLASYAKLTPIYSTEKNKRESAVKTQQSLLYRARTEKGTMALSLEYKNTENYLFCYDERERNPMMHQIVKKQVYPDNMATHAKYIHKHSAHYNHFDHKERFDFAQSQDGSFVLFAYNGPIGYTKTTHYPMVIAVSKDKVSQAMPDNLTFNDIPNAIYMVKDIKKSVLKSGKFTIEQMTRLDPPSIDDYFMLDIQNRLIPLVNLKETEHIFNPDRPNTYKTNKKYVYTYNAGNHYITFEVGPNQKDPIYRYLESLKIVSGSGAMPYEIDFERSGDYKNRVQFLKELQIKDGVNKPVNLYLILSQLTKSPKNYIFKTIFASTRRYGKDPSITAEIYIPRNHKDFYTYDDVNALVSNDGFIKNFVKATFKQYTYSTTP